ncbi:MAG TPA: sigma 54-interacting transcriptional regulator, partial [Candidatus Eisenbacteria bacterium]
SETLELQDVFGRIANSVRRVIPFDHMGVVRIQGGKWAIKHAATYPDCTRWTASPSERPAGESPDDDPCVARLCELTTWSPRMRPRPGPIRRIDDTFAELDPSFRGDSEILRAGARSTMWEPFRAGEPFRGGVWLSAYRTNAFADEHQEMLRPIAALLGTAVEHWRLWDTERRRRDRLDRIETLLGTLAESLDIRVVFDRISEATKPILPHGLMVLSEMKLEARAFDVVAVAGTSDLVGAPKRVPLTDEECSRRAIEFELMRDIPSELEPGTERNRLLLATGMRSWLRVPVRLAGEAHGSLSFFHREPARYDEGDVEIATRLADRVALMLSHQRLAEEARVATEARERAERLEETVETLVREVASRGRGRIVGDSPAWKDALMAVGRVASSDTTVLITGESGTGKEVIANLTHQGSPRAGKPFVAINCAALPEQLLESELFGHEKGAFTGAIATKIGRIEQASGGTLFLDEIAEMSPQVQAKFLRVLEQREFQRVGGNRTIKADVRVVAATNRDLGTSIERQTFREDLYYRLNVFQIHIPPLRERPDDILPLTEIFLQDLGRSIGRPAAGISRDAREWLLSYPWPGNVRELRNAIERAILLCDGGLITHDHLPSTPARPAVPARLSAALAAAPAAAPAPSSNGSSAPAPASAPDGMNIGAVERDLVAKALEQSRGNKSQAARVLGLSRAQLYSRIEKYRLQ